MSTSKSPAPTGPVSSTGVINNPFVSLRHKNFRYYWFGMCVSLIGTWMQNIAQPWLAYTLTSSPLLLGLVGALQFAPAFLFSLFAGVVIDRFSKKKILLVTQLSSLLITLVLAILVWTGWVRYWHILVCATVLGFINTLDMPTRQAFVIELVDKGHLMNGIALNSAVFNIARVVGPAVAGFVMEYFGIATCFFANAISFAAVLISLFFIRPHPPVIRRSESGRMLADIKEGLKYIYRNKILLNAAIGLAIIGTFALNNNVLVPVFAKNILLQKEAGFASLFSFLGIGAFFGAMIVATTSKSGPARFVRDFVPLIIGVLLILNGCANTYLATGLCLAATGFFFNMYSSTINSEMQLNTSNEFRGRVMSVYTMFFTGFIPIGSLYAGFVTEHFGPRYGFAACGMMIILLLLVPRFLFKIRHAGEEERAR
jgi:MFS family permease